MSSPPPQDVAQLKSRLAQLDGLLADGVLSAEAAREARGRIEARILALVMGGAPESSAASLPLALPATRTSRTSRRVALGLGAFVLVFAAAGYAWMGNTKGWAVTPGSPGAATPAEGGSGEAHPTDDAQIAAMVDKLAERLKTQPDDADGWSMLGRSYTSVGRHADALAAYKKAYALKPKDAQTMADFADGLAVVNNRSLDGEPEKLILQAVKLDGSNAKALALAGTVAFNHADYTVAIERWERAVKVSDPAGGFAQQLQGAIADARQKAGLPAAAAPDLFAAAAPAAATAAAPAAPAAPAAGQASISGRVTLRPDVLARVGPDDTVFIFARAPSGSKMPLAILRKRVRDLPLDFKLDDSLAMSPAAKLSSAAEVVVGARISKTGNAMPSPGDWQTLSAPMAVGAQDVRLEVGTAVP